MLAAQAVEWIVITLAAYANDIRDPACKLAVEVSPTSVLAANVNPPPPVAEIDIVLPVWNRVTFVLPLRQAVCNLVEPVAITAKLLAAEAVEWIVIMEPDCANETNDPPCNDATLVSGVSVDATKVKLLAPLPVVALIVITDAE